jgi:hypothetical protein
VRQSNYGRTAQWRLQSLQQLRQACARTGVAPAARRPGQGPALAHRATRCRDGWERPPGRFQVVQCARPLDPACNQAVGVLDSGQAASLNSRPRTSSILLYSPLAIRVCPSPGGGGGGRGESPRVERPVTPWGGPRRSPGRQDALPGGLPLCCGLDSSVERRRPWSAPRPGGCSVQDAAWTRLALFSRSAT